MTDEKEKKQSQWYSTDKLDDGTDFQDWEDDGVVNAPNYNKAYDGMMEEIQKKKKKEEE